MALEKGHYLIASLTARAFHTRARVVFETLAKKAPLGGHERPDPGELIAAATEICLAIELYMKAIYINKGHSVPKGHDLWTLFNELPFPELKEVITRKYDDLSRSRIGVPDIAEFSLTASGVKMSCDSQASNNGLTSLPEVLQTVATGFVSWRYVYEGLLKNEAINSRLPFRRLCLIADVLQSIQMARVTVSST